VIAGLVLAAGEGRRMGAPKALLVVDGLPLVARHAARLTEAGCGELVIVVRPALVASVEAFGTGARIVGASTAAQAESLEVGLAALPPWGELLVTPVDLLPARVETLRALLAELRRSGACAVTPEYAGRGGHPVALAASFGAARRPGEGVSLRAQLEALGPRRRRLPVDDPAVLGDFDTPAALDARAERWTIWPATG
jgi:nicotine blue oxidoreductase